MRIFCNYPNNGLPEQMREGDGLTFGSWTTAQKCTGYNQTICAIQTQVEKYFDGKFIEFYDGIDFTDKKNLI